MAFTSQVDEEKEARKAEMARAVLAGKSFLEAEAEFKGMSPEEIQEFVGKVTQGAKVDDPFEGGWLSGAIVAAAGATAAAAGSAAGAAGVGPPMLAAEAAAALAAAFLAPSSATTSACLPACLSVGCPECQKFSLPDLSAPSNLRCSATLEKVAICCAQA